MKHFLVAPLVVCTGVTTATAQRSKVNYDESKVPRYTLPDPLTCSDGSKVKTPKAWRGKRRPEIVELFEREMYGRAPGRPGKLSFEVKSEALALDDKAVRKEVVIRCRNGDREVSLDLLLYLPADGKIPVPVFLGLNFFGNQTIRNDSGITVTKSWVRNRKGRGNEKNKATEASRGKSADRWPVPMILARGCALATVYYGDIDPDFHDEFENGVHPLFYRDGQKRPAADEWGAIAAWAWGLSRALDYLETDATVDARRVAVVGHSRLGKTALWAGALDERFAMVVSNDSGCGGAALSRRRYGETVARITSVFPHWFCRNFSKYAGREDDLPLDQHMLIALIAPRPVLVCSATEDRWADPKGEFLSAFHAGPVYRLLGTDGMASSSMPEPDDLVKSRIGYYLRSGKHDMTHADWQAYLEFAEHHGVVKTPRK